MIPSMITYILILEFIYDSPQLTNNLYTFECPLWNNDTFTLNCESDYLGNGIYITSGTYQANLSGTLKILSGTLKILNPTKSFIFNGINNLREYKN